MYSSESVNARLIRTLVVEVVDRPMVQVMPRVDIYFGRSPALPPDILAMALWGVTKTIFETHCLFKKKGKKNITGLTDRTSLLD